MRASVITVLERPKGLDLVIDGLLGQVEQTGWEPRQVARCGKLVIEPQGAPVFKQLTGFELVAIDTSSMDDMRADESRNATRLAMGDETIRRMLTKFGFTYWPAPGASYAEALFEAVKLARGEVVIVVPELAYVAPEFVAKTMIALTMDPRSVIVLNIAARTPMHSPEPEQDYLGLLLDAGCESKLSEFDGHVPLSQHMPPVEAIALSHEALRATFVDGPVNFSPRFELATVALRLSNDAGMQFDVRAHGGDPDLIPWKLVVGEPRAPWLPDTKAFGDLCATIKQHAPPTAVLDERPTERSMWRRVFGG